MYIFIGNYTANIFLQHPFKYFRLKSDTLDTLCPYCYIEDSISMGTELVVKIHRKNDRMILENSGITNDSGVCKISFEKWLDGKDVLISDIEKMDVYLPNAKIVERFGEEVNFKPIIFENVDFQKDTIKLVLPFNAVQRFDFNLFFGEHNTTLPSYKFAIIADPHIGHHWDDFGTTGYYDDTIPNQWGGPLQTVKNVIDAINYESQNDPKLKFIVLKALNIPLNSIFGKLNSKMVVLTPFLNHLWILHFHQLEYGE